MILTILFAIYLTTATSAAMYEIYTVHWPVVKKEFITHEKDKVKWSTIQDYENRLKKESINRKIKFGDLKNEK